MYKLYIAALDERDDAIERAETAEAKLAAIRKRWRRFFVSLAIVAFVLVDLFLFGALVYTAARIWPM
jgi:hypothetical protein